MRPFVIISLVFFTFVGCSCAYNQKSEKPEMASCETLSMTMFNDTVDNILISACFDETWNFCVPEDTDCIMNHRLMCVEEQFQLKINQTKAWRYQKCWHNDELSS